MCVAENVCSLSCSSCDPSGGFLPPRLGTNGLKHNDIFMQYTKKIWRNREALTHAARTSQHHDSDCSSACSPLRVELTEGIIDCCHLGWHRPSVAISFLSSQPLSALKPLSFITKGTKVPSWVNALPLRREWQHCHSSFSPSLLRLHYVLKYLFNCLSYALISILHN